MPDELAEIIDYGKPIALAAVDLKREIVVRVWASCMDIGEAAKAAGVKRSVALTLLQSGEGVNLLKNEIDSRKARIGVSGDSIIMKLIETAQAATKAGKFKDAVLAYRTVAEMLGEIGGRDTAPGAINTSGPTQIIFGSPTKQLPEPS